MRFDFVVVADDFGAKWREFQRFPISSNFFFFLILFFVVLTRIARVHLLMKKMKRRIYDEYYHLPSGNLYSLQFFEFVSKLYRHHPSRLKNFSFLEILFEFLNFSW